jgi:acetylornithine/N-succinyldiaminopimelate aminotransferase
VPFGDLEAVKKAIGPNTAAILIEPIQGEGGVRVPPNQFLKSLRALCDQHGMLLIFDEVQCGMGRTGEMFAYQRTGGAPDIMALAKALGGGFPVGAFLTTKEAGKGMTAGTHGSTFGGNPLAMAAGNAVLDVMLADGFLDRVKRVGLLFKQRLAEIKDRYLTIIAEVRGDSRLPALRSRTPAGRCAARRHCSPSPATAWCGGPPRSATTMSAPRWACWARLRAARVPKARDARGRGVSAAPRHFPDPDQDPGRELRG